jgi:hypothetical protein
MLDENTQLAVRQPAAPAVRTARPVEVQEVQVVVPVQVSF